MKHDLNCNLQRRAKRLYALFACLVLTLPFAVGLANLAAHGERPESSYVSALLVVIAFAATTIFFLYRPEWYHLFPYRTFLEEGLP